jgi:hypothetical protein
VSISALALSPPDRERLAKLLGMLGSEHQGERDAAGLAAHRLVTASGLTWSSIVCIPQSEPMHAHHADPLNWRATATRARQFEHLINKWEFEFLAGLPRFPRLSAKQRGTLLAIVSRLRACGCSL